jgi:hypothetical protein
LWVAVGPRAADLDWRVCATTRPSSFGVGLFVPNEGTSLVSVVLLVGNQGPLGEGPAGTSASGYVEVGECAP